MANSHISGYEKLISHGYRYAKSILRNESDAEEAVQESFLKIERRIDGDFNNAIDFEQTEFRALYFTTLRNHCFDLIRKRGARKEVALLEADVVRSRQSQDSAVEYEMLEALKQLMDDLPENWAEALKLKSEGGLSYDEIATVIGCTRNQVRTWIYRARRQLEDGMVRQGLLSKTYAKKRI